MRDTSESHVLVIQIQISHTIMSVRVSKLNVVRDCGQGDIYSNPATHGCSRLLMPFTATHDDQGHFRPLKSFTDLLDLQLNLHVSLCVFTEEN